MMKFTNGGYKDGNLSGKGRIGSDLLCRSCQRQRGSQLWLSKWPLRLLRALLSFTPFTWCLALLQLPRQSTRRSIQPWSGPRIAGHSWWFSAPLSSRLWQQGFCSRAPSSRRGYMQTCSNPALWSMPPRRRPRRPQRAWKGLKAPYKWSDISCINRRRYSGFLWGYSNLGR